MSIDHRAWRLCNHWFDRQVAELSGFPRARMDCRLRAHNGVFPLIIRVCPINVLWLFSSSPISTVYSALHLDALMCYEVHFPHLASDIKWTACIFTPQEICLALMTPVGWKTGHTTVTGEHLPWGTNIDVIQMGSWLGHTCLATCDDVFHGVFCVGAVATNERRIYSDITIYTTVYISLFFIRANDAHLYEADRPLINSIHNRTKDCLPKWSEFISAISGTYNCLSCRCWRIQ